MLFTLSDIIIILPGMSFYDVHLLFFFHRRPWVFLFKIRYNFVNSQTFRYPTSMKNVGGGFGMDRMKTMLLFKISKCNTHSYILPDTTNTCNHNNVYYSLAISTV